MADEQERLRVAFEKFLEFLQADGRSKNESETIAWLIQHMQTATSLPSLSDDGRAPPTTQRRPLAAVSQNLRPARRSSAGNR